MKKLNISFDRIMSIIALTAGVVALLFSFQANQLAKEANQIALQQAMARVVVLNASDGGSGSDNYITCRHDIRVTNLGGAATALVGFDATITFKDKKLIAESSGEHFAFNRSRIIPDVGDFYITLMAPSSPGEVLKLEEIAGKNEQPLPLSIDSFATVDFGTKFRYVIDRSEYEIDSGYRLDSQNVLRKFPLPGYTPIEVEYTLHMASGQSVTTPKLSCYYIKQ